MKRPSGWVANPQAMAAVSERKQYMGDPALGSMVDGDTWLTPRFILSTLGAFDLDPCATPLAPGWTAPRGLTVEDDGLSAEWSGRVFMNPPFSNTGPWLRRHAEHGNGISLVPAAVESKVWREVVWLKARGILLLHGRTRFCNPDGSSTQGRPLRSVALIGWTLEDAQVLKLSPLAGVYVDAWQQK